MMARANPKVAFGLAAFALGGLIVPAHAIDAFFPSFGNDAIDVKQYDITLDVDPQAGEDHWPGIRLTFRHRTRLPVACNEKKNNEDTLRLSVE